MPPPNTPNTMDQPAGRSQIGAAQTPAQRDMMYCHECRDEWYRDEHGLTCPECGSDFTEIIEAGQDPRDDEMFGHVHHDDDEDSMPDLEEASAGQHPLQHHNPFRDIGNDGGQDRLQWRQVGPGRFAVTGTVYRTVSPGRPGGADGANIMGNFASMLNNIIGGGHGVPQGQAAQGGPNQNTPGAGSGAGAGTTPGGHRFHYTSSARLYPRDAANAEPRMEPVDELNNVLAGLMAALGGPEGTSQHHHHGPDGQAHEFPFNPLMALFSGLMPGGNAAAGDFVYSQEGLDRIISQLMEQTATSNAPGPAPQQDIDALPRKFIGTEDLGPEGRAECSICMDEVNIGEEVTELPCHHWFHHPCISAWLGEHDTCPHCRKGISKTNENAQDSVEASSGDTGNSAATGSRSQMPGSFVTGEGTSEHPFIVQESPQQNPQDPSSQARPGSAEGGTSSGGLGERLRRGLFGPPSR